MKFHVVKYTERSRKGELAIITEEEYKKILFDDNSEAFKDLGELTLDNTCPEFKNAIITEPGT